MQPYSTLGFYYDYVSNLDRRRLLADQISLVLAQRKPAEKSVLDIGCGTGNLIQILALRKISCIGLDASTIMLDMARKKIYGPGSVNLIHCDILEYTEKSIAYVAVATSFVFCYLFSDDQLSRALNISHAALQPSGVLIFDMLTPLGVREYFQSQAIRKIPGGVMVVSLLSSDVATGNYEVEYQFSRGDVVEEELHRGRGYERETVHRLAKEAKFRKVEFGPRAGDNDMSGAYEVYCWK